MIRFAMSRILLLVLTQVALLCLVPAANAATDDERAVQTLIDTKHFGFGAIDKDGNVTEGEAALKRIVKNQGGLQQLFTVFDRATLAGKCYALVGIRQLAPSTYPEFVKQLDPWKSLKVKTVVDEKVVQEKLSDVMRMIETGFYNRYLSASE